MLISDNPRKDTEKSQAGAMTDLAFTGDWIRETAETIEVDVPVHSTCEDSS